MITCPKALLRYSVIVSKGDALHEQEIPAAVFTNPQSQLTSGIEIEGVERKIKKVKSLLSRIVLDYSEKESIASQRN